MKCEDNLVIHGPHSSEALSHDLVGFTIGRNFFPRSGSVVDLSGKGKLGGEEDAPARDCVMQGWDRDG